MKTENLIELLGEDISTPPQSNILLPLILGAMASFFALLIIPIFSSFGIRPHYFSALTHGLASIKQIMPFVLALSLFPIVSALRFPEESGRGAWRKLLPFLSVAIISFAIGFFGEPEAGRAMAMRGKSLHYCLPLIPVFAVPTFLLLLKFMREGAPTSPMRSGLYAGLLAGAVGCMVYAFTCTDDHPLFWSWAYSAGIFISGGLGAIFGRFALKW